MGRIGERTRREGRISRSIRRTVSSYDIGVTITQRLDGKDKDRYVFKGDADTIANSSRVRYGIADKDKAIEIVTQRESMPKDGPAEDEDAGLCTVCYSEAANTVLLDCGHGSVCLACAIDSMKKNNHCLFCRAKVVQIIEIAPEEVRKGLYKVLNSFYVSDDPS